VTEVRQEVMKMKLKGQEFLAVGEGLKVAVSADLDVVVKNGAASLTMEVSSEELNGTFVSDEGASDGMLFDFNGVFTAADGTTSKGMVHFMKTEDGLTETFLEIVR
jgi:hypothetical protein